MTTTSTSSRPEPPRVKRVEVDDDGTGRPGYFEGVVLAELDCGTDGTVTAYRTEKEQIAVVSDIGEGRFDVHDEFEQFDETWGEDEPDFVADAAEALGIEYRRKLDV